MLFFDIIKLFFRKKEIEKLLKEINLIKNQLNDHCNTLKKEIKSNKIVKHFFNNFIRVEIDNEGITTVITEYGIKKIKNMNHEEKMYFLFGLINGFEIKIENNYDTDFCSVNAFSVLVKFIYKIIIEEFNQEKRELEEVLGNLKNG